MPGFITLLTTICNLNVFCQIKYIHKIHTTVVVEYSVRTNVRGVGACSRAERGGRTLGSARGVLRAPEGWRMPPVSSAAYLHSRPPSDPADQSTTNDIVQFVMRRE